MCSREWCGALWCVTRSIATDCDLRMYAEPQRYVIDIDSTDASVYQFQDSDIGNKAEMFKNKLFMMNHGTADGKLV